MMQSTSFCSYVNALVYQDIGDKVIFFLLSASLVTPSIVFDGLEINKVTGNSVDRTTLSPEKCLVNMYTRASILYSYFEIFV